MPHRAPVVGVDLVFIDEIADAIATFGERYLSRVYTPAEIAYCRGATATHAEHFAARFAAKEAVLKVLGAPDEGIDWRSIEVERRDDGACSLRLTGHARDIAARARIRDLSVSLTHAGGYAAAVVVATRPGAVA